MDDDMDTITCTVDWATDAYTEAIIITIRDGPVYDYQDPGWTGDAQRPIYLTRQFNLFDDNDPPQQVLSNVSLRSAFPRNVSSSTLRVVGCTAVGRHVPTALPVYVAAMSKLVLNSDTTDEPWQDFIYPRYTKPCRDTGCISTVANSTQPGLVTVGAAFGWPEATGRTEAVFVTTNDLDPRLLRISPASLDAENFTDPTNSIGVGIPDFLALSARGFAATANGNLYFNSQEAVGAAFCRASTYDQCLQTNYRFGSGPATCSTQGTVSSSMKFNALGNPWASPNDNGLYIVDGGCGLLYQIDQDSFTLNADLAACAQLGACGTTNILANLTEKAYFRPNDGQATSVVGDVERDILYIAYANQCGIMSLKLSTAGVLGWVTGTNITVNSTTIGSPLCGYAGDGSAGMCVQRDYYG